jgi:hypothetical protein
MAISFLMELLRATTHLKDLADIASLDTSRFGAISCHFVCCEFYLIKRVNMDRTGIAALRRKKSLPFLIAVLTSVALEDNRLIARIQKRHVNRYAFRRDRIADGE